MPQPGCAMLFLYNTTNHFERLCVLHMRGWQAGSDSDGGSCEGAVQHTWPGLQAIHKLEA